VFFGENCFGDQIGFRYTAEGICLPMLLALATVELYRMAPDFDRLFPEVMTERYAMTDPEHLAAARQGVPTLPPGHWYCPILSPLVGGSAEPHNFMAMTPIPSKVPIRRFATYDCSRSVQWRREGGRGQNASSASPAWGHESVCGTVPG